MQVSSLPFWCLPVVLLGWPHSGFSGLGSDVGSTTGSGSVGAPAGAFAAAGTVPAEVFESLSSDIILVNPVTLKSLLDAAW